MRNADRWRRTLLSVTAFRALGALGVGVAVGLGLGACSDGTASGDPLSGQVDLVSADRAVMSFYAASRFLEQASMGPTLASVEELRTIGPQAWLSRQLDLPVTQITAPDAYINYQLNQDRELEQRAWRYHRDELYRLFLSAPDQLRARVAWVLSNFVVVSTNKVQPYGGTEHMNTLMRYAFGRYGDLLKAVTRNPAMGFFLDNDQNSVWGLNENYGRELMQLFVVGLVQLNPDGSVKRDGNGTPLETYTQEDVIAVTRALTGWSWAEPDQQRPGANFANYGKPMEAVWAERHDRGAKTVMGRTIPAGQNAEQDLDSLIDILVSHPNAAPFVSLRLIQGLTASAPSPDYLQRVSEVFVRSKGDLSQVVGAILLDPEARAGDLPGAGSSGFGRIKEPHLVFVSMLRGLECTKPPPSRWNPEESWVAWQQTPINAPSVFSFYPPNHVAPVSGLLAPEQKMLTSKEFAERLGTYAYNLENVQGLEAAGCRLGVFHDAAQRSTQDVLALIGERYFRGAMPAAVQQALMGSVQDLWNKSDPKVLSAALIATSTLAPGFGVTR